MEQWKALDGIVENGQNYEVSTLGNVRNIKTQRILKTFDAHGYPTVTLALKGKNKKHLVHRLVAQAYIPNTDNKPEVNHKDGNKCNPSVDNLEWVTHSENIQHAYDTALEGRDKAKGPKRKPGSGFHGPKGEAHGKAKLNDEIVRTIRELADSGTPKKELARIYKVDPKAIRAIVNKSTWKHVI